MLERQKIVEELQQARNEGKSEATTEVFRRHCPETALALAFPLSLLLNGIAEEEVALELMLKLRGEPRRTMKRLVEMRNPITEVDTSNGKYAVLFYSENMGRGELIGPVLAGYNSLDEASAALDLALSEATADFFIALIEHESDADRLRAEFAAKPPILF